MSNFNEIEHRPLRAYNRLVLAHNTLEDGGKAPLEDYLSQFSDSEKMEMKVISDMIKRKGVKFTKDWVTKGLTFTDDDYKLVEEVM